MGEGRDEKEMDRKEAKGDTMGFFVRERKKLFKRPKSVRLGRIV